MPKVKMLCFVLLAASATLAAAGPAQATSVVTFTGDDYGLIDETQRQAKAVFTQTADGFTVTLTNLMTVTPGVNNGQNAVTGGEDLLTAVFFNIHGSTPSPSLAAITALAAPGNIVNETHSSEGWTYNKTTHQYDPTLGDAAANVRQQVQSGNVTGEWAYSGAVGKVFSQPVLDEGPVTVQYGISSSGLGVFGPGSLFQGDLSYPSVNLDDPVDPNGPNYGIVSAGAALTNSGIGEKPLILDSVTFTLTGGVDVGSIDDVWFQYGTSFSEPNFTVYVEGEPEPHPPYTAPEPVTIVGVCVGLCGLAGYVRRRRR